MKKKLIIGISIALIILVIAASLARRRSTVDKYETAVIDRGDITERITATGTINPVISVQVGSQVSGRIVKIYADFNSEVKKGQIVAQLEIDLYQSKVEQSDANFKMAQAQVKEAKAALDDAESNLRRARNLNRGKVLSDRDLEVAVTKYDAAKASHNAALAREDNSLALLNSAKFDLEHTTIYSPVDGIVISRNCDVGQTVVASFQTPNLFLIAKDLTKMQVDAYVDEADIGKVKDGQEVLFTVDAYPEKVFTGTVSQVRFAPKEQQNVVSYATIVEVPNPALMLRPGMTASVSIIAKKKKNVLRVANAALRFKPDSEDKELSRYSNTGEHELSTEDDPLISQHRLWILEKDGSVKVISAQIGIFDTHYTEIVEGQIKDKDVVITGYNPQWRKTDSSKQSFFSFGGRRQ